MHSRRRGFTLIELMVVIGILLALTTIVVVLFRPDTGSKLREAGRVSQATILGARDRALHAKAPRGFRITRDPSDLNIGTGMVYLQPIDPVTYATGSLFLERPDWQPDGTLDSSDVLIVRGVVPPAPAPNVDWQNLTDFFPTQPRIRIPAGTGRWYSFAWAPTGTYALNATSACLQLTTPFVDPGAPGQVAWDRTSSNSSCDLEMRPEMLPNQQPVNLPSGIVIDLANSSPNARLDIMFSPRGAITGPLSAQGPIYLMLRDVRDVTEGINPLSVTATQRDVLIVTIFPQTGHVASYPPNMTDVDVDGLADDIFRFAKLGSSAGG